MRLGRLAPLRVNARPRQKYAKLSFAGARFLGETLVGQKPRQLKPAPLAQSAERLHGKEKVYGSIP
jgi:hypothetical protein